MNDDPGASGQFEPLEPEDLPGLERHQYSLCQRLHEIDPYLAQVYAGAAHIIADASNPARTRIAAHVARDFIDLIPDVFSEAETWGSKRLGELPEKTRVGLAWSRIKDTAIAHQNGCDVSIGDDIALIEEWARAPKKLQTRRQRLGSALGLPEDDELLRKLHRLRNDFVRRAHVPPPKSTPKSQREEEEQFAEIVELFGQLDDILWSLVRTHYERVDELDELLETEEPGPEDVDALLPIIVSGTARAYFFNELNNPDWLPLLREEGLFAAPPLGVQDSDTGVVYTRQWHASECLARFAKKAPNTVKDIILDVLNCQEIANGRIIADFLEAAMNMPASEAADISAAIRDRSVFPPEGYYEPRIGRLIQKLGQGGEGEEALALAREALALEEMEVEGAGPNRWQPRRILDDHAYDSILRDVFPILVDNIGLGALCLLCDLLRKAFRIRERDSKGVEDLSHLRRPAIEDSAVNIGHSLQDSLIDATRDAADQLITDAETPAEEVFETLDRHDHKIFERIKLHLLAQHPYSDPERVRDLLLDNEIMQYPKSLAYEYYELLEAGFPLLEAEEQKTIYNRIREGLDIDPMVKNYETSRRESPPEESKRRWVEDWQYKRLCRVPEEILPDDLKQLYERLHRDRSPEDQEVFQAGAHWVEGEKGRTKEELLDMAVSDVWDFLDAWEPQETVSLPYKEQADELREAVAAEPAGFVTQLDSYSLGRAEYASAILQGLRDACEEGEGFDWGPVLVMCRGIVSRTIEEEDNSWGWCKQEIAELFKAGLKEGPCEIPFALRDEVWSSIEPLTHKPHPKNDKEMGLPDRSRELPTRAINSVRGRAFEAALWYGQWCARHLLDDEAPGDKNIFEDGIPEVRRVFEERLDPKQEKTRAIHSLFGMQFRFLWWLDRTWVKQNLGRIFPQRPEAKERWRAAWEAYLNFTGLYLDLIQLLKEHYELGLERLGETPPEEVSTEGPAGKLTEHIVALYIWGYEELDGSLIKKLYSVPHSSVRAHIASFLSRYIDSGGDEVAPEHFERVYDLWKWRLDELKDQEPAQRQEEVESFGWLFTIHRLEPKRSLELFEQALELSRGNTECLGEVMEYLTERAEADPGKAVGVLKLILKEGEPQGWELWEISQQARPILQAAKTSDDEEAAQIADECINQFGERGIDDFRDMLDREE